MAKPTNTLKKLLVPEEPGHVVIFTDGACLGNPGPGGYGAILRFKGKERRVSSGEEKTTNNCMELMVDYGFWSATSDPGAGLRHRP